MAWLYRELRDKPGIQLHFGPVGDLFQNSLSQRVRHAEPPPETILEIEAKLAAATNADEERNWRIQLGWTWASKGHYARAAAEIAKDAANPSPGNILISPHLNPSACRWSVYLRSAETMRFFAAHPGMMAPARQTIARLNVHGPNYGGAPARGWLPPDVVTDRLTAMGPGVLALVYKGMQLSTQGCDDRSALVRVIANVGDQRDLPALIDTYALLVGTKPTGMSFCDDNHARSEQAIDQAIAKLTKTKNPGKSRQERAKFWHEWWVANARRIVLGEKQKPSRGKP